MVVRSAIYSFQSIRLAARIIAWIVHLSLLVADRTDHDVSAQMQVNPFTQKVVQRG